jgi:hypothetical protein
MSMTSLSGWMRGSSRSTVPSASSVAQRVPLGGTRERRRDGTSVTDRGRPIRRDRHDDRHDAGEDSGACDVGVMPFNGGRLRAERCPESAPSHFRNPLADRQLLCAAADKICVRWNVGGIAISRMSIQSRTDLAHVPAQFEKLSDCTGRYGVRPSTIGWTAIWFTRTRHSDRPSGVMFVLCARGWCEGR